MDYTPQVRYLTELSPENTPSRVAITIPGCSEGEELLCPLSKLRSLAIRSVDTGCITPPEVRFRLKSAVLYVYCAESSRRDGVGGAGGCFSSARLPAPPNVGAAPVGVSKEAVPRYIFSL